MHIVLVGFGRYESAREQFHFGVPAEVADDYATHLLSLQREGDPIFLTEAELESYPLIRIKLADPSSSFNFYQHRLHGGEIELREPLAAKLIKDGSFLPA